MRIPGIEHYLRAPGLELARAAVVLRGVFATMFLGQMLVALVLAGLTRLLSGPIARPSAVLGWTLVALAALELPLGLTLAAVTARGRDRRRALAAALLGAVVMSTPAWFAALALATGQAGAPVLVLGGLLALDYAAGIAGMGRIAARAAQAPPATPS